jgi:uncharacterized protein (TIGR02145 family)
MKIILFFIIVLCSLVLYSQKPIKESKVIFKADSIAYLKNGEKLTGTLTIEREYGLQKVDYLNGVKSGKHDFYANGILIKTQTYADGKQNGPEFKWDSSHVFLLYHWNYLDGKPHGKCIRYYEKSWQIKEVLYYNQGLLDGLYTMYSPKGIKLVETTYKDGKLHGRRISYYPDSGKKGLVMNFKENKWFGFIEFYNNQEILINSKFIGYNENDEIKDWGGNLWVFRNYGAEFWKYYFDKSSKLTTVQYYLPNYLVKEVKIENNKANLRVDYNKNSPRVEINFDYCKLQFEGYSKEDVCTKDFTRWYQNGQMAEKIVYDNTTKYNADRGVNLVKKWYPNGNMEYEFKNDSNLVRKWYDSGNLRLERSENNLTEFYPNGSIKYSLRRIEQSFLSYEYSLNIYDISGSLLYSYKEVGPNLYKKNKEDYQRLFEGKFKDQIQEKTFSVGGVIYKLKGIGFTISVNQYKDSSQFLKDSSTYCLWDIRPDLLTNNPEKGFEYNFFSCISPIEYGALYRGLKEGKWVYNNYHGDYQVSTYISGLLNGPFYDKLTPDGLYLSIDNENYALDNKNIFFEGIFKNGRIDGVLEGYSPWEFYRILDTLDTRIITKFENNDTLWIKKYTNGKLAEETNYSRNHPEYKVVYKNNSVFYRAKYRENGRKIAETWYKYIFNNPSAEADSLMICYHPTGNVKAKVFYDSKQKATSTLFDQQGVEIQSVKIGNQIWTTSNLDISDYLNGALLSNSNTDSQWEESFFKRRSAWCYYNNDSSSNYQSKLYNWLVVDNSVNIIPPGWHVPSIKEIKELEKYLGGSQITGVKLKSTSEWINGKQGTNLVQFNAFPSGIKDAYEGFYNKGTEFGMWTTESGEGSGALKFKLLSNSNSSVVENVLVGDGCVIRLIKDY